MAPANNNGHDPLSEFQAALNAAKAAAASAQNQVKESNDKVAALQRIVDDLTKSHDALDKLHASTAKEVNDATALRASLLPELNDQLSQDHRDAISKTVTEADKVVDDLRGKLDVAQKAVDQAEDDANGKHTAVTRPKAEFDAAQADVKQLATDLGAAKDKVTRYKTALKTAYDGGKWTEAYYLSVELGNAIGAAADLNKPEVEQAASAAVQSKWKDFIDASKAAADADNTLATARINRTAQEQALAQAEKDRDANIKKKLDELIKPVEPQAAAAPQAAVALQAAIARKAA